MLSSKKPVEWHLVTGEFPPNPGGVGDYTFQLAEALAESVDAVHVWAPAVDAGTHLAGIDKVRLHPLPRPFGWRWLRGLNRGLAGTDKDSIVLIQYVPHMYGWKAMNLAFCAWVYRQRRRNLLVMFHEVAYPFKPGQPWRHHLLAVVHRVMAWVMVRSARFSFTSIASYEQLLRKLAPRARIQLVGIFSNVPFHASPQLNRPPYDINGDTVGIFSSFGSEICDMLYRYLPAVLGNPDVRLFLIGPAGSFIERFVSAFPEFKNRIMTSGRVNARQAAEQFEKCTALLQLYPDGAAGARGTLMAALASGLPVITTAGPLTDPLLKAGGVILFSDQDPAAVRKVIDDLLADKNHARILGFATRRFYETHFDVGVTVAALQQAANLSGDTWRKTSSPVKARGVPGSA